MGVRGVTVRAGHVPADSKYRDHTQCQSATNGSDRPQKTRTAGGWGVGDHHFGDLVSKLLPNRQAAFKLS